MSQNWASWRAAKFLQNKTFLALMVSVAITAGSAASAKADDDEEMRQEVFSPAMTIAGLTLAHSMIALYDLPPMEMRSMQWIADEDLRVAQEAAQEPEQGSADGLPDAFDYAGLSVIMSLNLMGESPEAADIIATGVAALHEALDRERPVRVGADLEMTPLHTLFMACLLVGDDQEAFGALADDLDLSADQLEACVESFDREIDHWSIELSPFVSGLPDTAEGSTGRFRTRFESGDVRDRRNVLERLQNDDFLQEAIELLNEFLLVPTDVIVTVGECEEARPLWDRDAGRAVMCSNDIVTLSALTQ